MHSRARSIRKRTHHVQLVHKLFSIEADWHREKDTLLREIQRLQREVTAITSRYNESCKQIQDMVTRLKAEPPPPLPERAEYEVTLVLRCEPGSDHHKNVKEGKKVAVLNDRVEDRPQLASLVKIPPERRLTASKSAPMIRSVLRKPVLVTRKSEEKPSARVEPPGRIETIKDDSNGSEKEQVFAKYVQVHADRWEDVARGFAYMLDEEGDVDGLRWYEEYRGEKQWDKPLMEWASEKGEDVTAIHRICWQGRNLAGVELYKVGKQLRLWKKA